MRRPQAQSARDFPPDQALKRRQECPIALRARPLNDKAAKPDHIPACRKFFPMNAAVSPQLIIHIGDPKTGTSSVGLHWGARGCEISHAI